MSIQHDIIDLVPLQHSGQKSAVGIVSLNYSTGTRLPYQLLWRPPFRRSYLSVIYEVCRKLRPSVRTLHITNVKHIYVGFNRSTNLNPKYYMWDNFSTSA